MKLRYLPMALNGAYPLDMSQFSNLFHATRIPSKGKDVLSVYPNSRYFSVFICSKFHRSFNIGDFGYY